MIHRVWKIQGSFRAGHFYGCGLDMHVRSEALNSIRAFHEIMHKLMTR